MRLTQGPYRRPISRLFSRKVEDSLRLRLLGLAAFWLVAVSVAWVGGSPWSWLGGAFVATCGHTFSWYRRRRSLGVWTIVMALVVVGLALVMRVEILEALEGNWLPLAHFLLLVQAISSFDIRTRGGLYAGLGLSGIVLVFASQQAFSLSFGLFLLMYAALLMAFLAIALLDDETETAQARPARVGIPMLGFWSGMVAAILLFSVAAFMLLPRGDRNSAGYEQVAALPITGNPWAPDPASPTQQDSQSSGRPSSSKPEKMSPPLEGLQARDLRSVGDKLDRPVESPKATSREEVIKGIGGLTGLATAAGGDEIVMHVRSPVASYWRGNVFDTFDGRFWHSDSTARPGTDAGGVLGDHPRYTQTYFIHRAQPGSLFMGYRGVEVHPSEETAYRKFLESERSYQVLSVQPFFVREELQNDRPGRAPERYYDIPPSMEWLPGVANQVTAGANSGFEKAVSIVEFLQNNGQYDDSATVHLKSSAQLDDLLLDGRAPAWTSQRPR